MTTNLRARNKQAAMDQVRSVAFDLLSARGFDAVTVEEIAAEAAVSPSTVYRYFGTKEALVLSSVRPAQLMERLADDASERSPLEAIRHAATRVWGKDESALTELALVLDNPTLLVAWERQLLDHREPLSQVLATRRGAKSAGIKDEAVAAVGLAILATVLPRWHAKDGGKKTLDKLLGKAHSTLCR